MAKNIRKNRLLGGLVLLLWALPFPARAALDLQGTRSIGMGGGLRASATGESAVLLNPAGLALAKTYVISGLYQFRLSDSAHLANASVVDSVTTSIAAGVFYSFSQAEPSRYIPQVGVDPVHLAETRQTHEAGLSLAYGYNNMLYMGVTARYVNISISGFDPALDQYKLGTLGSSTVPSDPIKATEYQAKVDTFKAAYLLNDVNTVTLDIGAILRPWAGLSIAVVGYNLVPIEGHTFPIELGLGLAYQFGTRFLAEFDTVLDFSTDEALAASFHGGGELFLADMVAIRGGAMYDMFQEATFVTAGLGIVTSKVGLDVGLRQMVDGGNESLLAFSIKLYLQ